MTKKHKVITVERNGGFAARCEDCDAITFGGFPRRSDARAALEGHEQEEAPAEQQLDEGQATPKGNQNMDTVAPTNEIETNRIPAVRQLFDELHDLEPGHMLILDKLDPFYIDCPDSRVRDKSTIKDADSIELGVSWHYFGRFHDFLGREIEEPSPSGVPTFVRDTPNAVHRGDEWFFVSGGRYLAYSEQEEFHGVTIEFVSPGVLKEIRERQRERWIEAHQAELDAHRPAWATETTVEVAGDPVPYDEIWFVRHVGAVRIDVGFEHEDGRWTGDTTPSVYLPTIEGNDVTPERMREIARDLLEAASILDD